jgi:hypothetical protein
VWTGTTIQRSLGANRASRGSFPRAAHEERLHRTDENDRGHKQAAAPPPPCSRGEREGAFEDQEFADEAVQTGQA